MCDTKDSSDAQGERRETQRVLNPEQHWPERTRRRQGAHVFLLMWQFVHVCRAPLSWALGAVKVLDGPLDSQ